ncbi:MAG: hypothetical protein V1712_01325 [Patescibacteria group bacterium]
MKKDKIKYLFFILPLLMFVTTSIDAIAPFHGIAINEKTKECGGYEATYKLPQGWDKYITEDGKLIGGKCARDEIVCQGLLDKYYCKYNEVKSTCHLSEEDCQQGCQLTAIETPYGQCVFAGWDKSEPQSCCEQLGLNFVSDNIGTLSLMEKLRIWNITNNEIVTKILILIILLLCLVGSIIIIRVLIKFIYSLVRKRRT